MPPIPWVIGVIGIIQLIVGADTGIDSPTIASMRAFQMILVDIQTNNQRRTLVGATIHHERIRRVIEYSSGFVYFGGDGQLDPSAQKILVVASHFASGKSNKFIE